MVTRICQTGTRNKEGKKKGQKWASSDWCVCLEASRQSNKLPPPPPHNQPLGSQPLMDLTCHRQAALIKWGKAIWGMRQATPAAFASSPPHFLPQCHIDPPQREFPFILQPKRVLCNDTNSLLLTLTAPLRSSSLLLYFSPRVLGFTSLLPLLASHSYTRDINWFNNESSLQGVGENGLKSTSNHYCGRCLHAVVWGKLQVLPCTSWTLRQSVHGEKYLIGGKIPEEKSQFCS